MSSPSAPVPPNRRNNVRQTLRRGGTALGMMIGDYFGVTEQSQVVNGGWSDVAQRRAEGGSVGFGTLSRRRSEDPPDYNSLEMGNLHSNMQSFDPDDLSDDSSEDEDAFAPMPNIPSSQQRSGGASPGQSGRVISMFGHEDPGRMQAVTRPQPQRAVENINGGRNVGGANDTITDPEMGVKYYLEYIRAEKIVKRRQNDNAASEFFGGGRERAMSDSGEGGFRGRLNSSVDPAELRRKKKQKKTGRTKLERQSTMVREELESLPTFWPIFIIGVTFVQICVVIVLMVLNGFAPFDYQPREHTASYPSLFNISGNASVTYYEFTNLWFGIDLLDLIHSGAKFSPCMRKDIAIINRNIQQRNREKESGGLGCCQNKIWAGTVLEEDCVTSTTTNSSGIDFLNTPCKDTTQILANFHPCCISITGQCKVMHVRECLDRGGVYHSDKDSCNDTNCLDSVCGISGIGTENNDPLRPSGTQLWRLITAMFIHLGVIHWLVIAVVQLYLGIKIEITVGFVRIALIYIISGVGGNLMSAIFIPYQVNGGASPSVFGLLSVVFVELFQFWQVVEHAWLEVVKLSSIFIFLLAFGTLPFIDNLANIGGFIFGIPTAIIFLPYITFGKVDAWRKRILLIICIPVLILMFAVGLIVFYLVPDTDFCEGCHYFNCIPYTSSFCQNEISDPDPEIFAL